VTELDGVSRTALSVAAARARESARPDRLFDDPYAQRFTGTAKRSSFWMPGTEGKRVVGAFGDYFALRTRFFDTFFEEAGKRQVVILGAGLDTRAYRLDWPDGTTLFELDLPPVFAYKGGVLSGEQPRCRRVEVAADLTGDWPAALADNGFTATEPTAWLAEGLLMYLGEDNVQRLLGAAAALSTPDSEIAVEHSGFSVDARALSSVADLGPERLRQLVAGAGKAGEALTGSGWEIVEQHSIPDLAHAHGRPVPPAFAEGSERAGRTRLIRARPAPA
jgi:methyltransferase (TIGR00027 family)